MATPVELKTGREAEVLVEQVRERYGRIAKEGASGCCGPGQGSSCGPTEAAVAEGIGYTAEDVAQAGEANLGLGCGAPVGFLELKEGETVLDLGSGAGIDVFLAARRVGPAGKVIGVDMTPEMIEKARANAARLGLPQVEFRAGRLEALPVEDASVDAVTSNCVINLVPDKRAVFRETARVLRGGGRMVVSDIILDGELPERVARDVYAYVGCISGAAGREEYFSWLREAGFSQVEVLRDVDYVAGLEEAAPEEVRAFAERTGIDPADVRGKIRSVTYRATRPASCCAPSCCA